jgi:DNA polymerase III subunit delta'
MLFKNVIGQNGIRSKLVDMVSRNRLSHALMLTAPEGSGGLPLALAFSQYLLCEKIRQKPDLSVSLFVAETAAPHTIPADACGICPACLRAQQMIHPDIHYSFPVVSKKPGDKPLSSDYLPAWREFAAQFPYGNIFDWLNFINAENKQGNISANECNDIIRKLSLKSFESGYKILIVWMPEYLGKEGNKLLKLIEEPPPETVFILVTENEALVLPTLLSRMQLIKVPKLEDREIASALTGLSGIPAEQAQKLAAVSQGNYREALQLLQHAGEDWQALLRDWLNAILKAGPVAQVRWVEEISKAGRERQKQFLQYFIHLLSVAVRIGIQGDTGTADISDSEKDFGRRLNKIADLTCQRAIIGELDQAVYYIERNANAKILFHALTIKLYHLMANREQVLMI